MLSTGTNYPITVNSDTSFLYSFGEAPGCPIIYKSVDVTIADPLPIFQVFGDTSICTNQDLMLWTDAYGVEFKWMKNGSFAGNNDSLLISYEQLQQSDAIQLEVFDDCHSYSIPVNILFYPLTIYDLGYDTIKVCKWTDTSILVSNTIYDTVFWQISNNSDTIESFTYTFYGNHSQLVYGWAIDSNGCQSTTDSVIFDVPSHSLTVDVSSSLFCTGDSVLVTYQTTLDSVIFHTPSGNYVDDSLWLTVDDLTAGTYSVEGWDRLGCHYFDSLTFSNNDLPVQPLVSDTILCLSDYFGQSFVDSNYTIVWNYFSIDSVEVGGNAWYEIEVTDNQTGCTWSDSIYIVSVNCSDDLPNVFTPNGDGVNDFFIIDEAIIYPNNYLVIINRWGQIVYKAHGYRNTFDGLNLTDGVYFYRFYHDYKNKPENLKQGFFHLIR